ncbi:beta and beta-prime subunits of DNA dependent RNA-polymerase [Paxillus ammoniavirescens]|nr:beta and beta-prime subunits of DNA dependent RNA-polymerase [Paxillus ammoniavirescens]
MGIVQDRPCGIHFTFRDTFLDWNHVQNILLWIPDWDGTVPTLTIIRPKPLWKGKQILSMVIPRGINIHRAPDPKSSHPVFDNGVMIDNGGIMFGIVDKKTVGAMQDGLSHLFTGIQTVTHFWLFHNGLSIGISDVIAGPKVMNYIVQCISDKKQQVAEIIEDTYHDHLKPVPGMTIRESFESKVEGELNRACDDSGQYTQKNLKGDNNVKQMVTAGSKGSYINISQMSVCVGQRSVEGWRIPFGFCYRTLPHLTKDDFSPEGLTPQEFFFHAMAGREGLIDTAVKTIKMGHLPAGSRSSPPQALTLSPLVISTAVKTAETGYIQRLVKALEDVTVSYDRTVQSLLGDLIQFIYGEDGMDGAFITRQKIDTFGPSDKEFEHNYWVDVTDKEGGFLPGVLQIGIDDSSLELQAKLDEEYGRLALTSSPLVINTAVKTVDVTPCLVL